MDVPKHPDDVILERNGAEVIGLVGGYNNKFNTAKLTLKITNVV